MRTHTLSHSAELTTENPKCLFSFISAQHFSETTMCKDTDVALEVIAQASSHQVVGFLLLPQTVQGQALHRQGLCTEMRRL